MHKFFSPSSASDGDSGAATYFTYVNGLVRGQFASPRLTRCHSGLAARMSIGAIPTAMIPPAASGVPGHTATIPTTAPILPPNHTIYINNLNEKIKTDELKKSLYAVFVQFGQILDIITGKSVKMRGQAFVVFSEISSARSALEAMRGFPLYEKPMCINFARTTSDIIAKREGTYVERPKRQPPPPPLPPPAQQQNSTIDAAALIGGGSARAIRRRQQRLAAAQAAALAAENGSSTAGGSSASPQAPSVSASHPPPINPATIPDQPPNKILFLTNLPEDANEAMLGMLFAPFVGFREIRMVPSRHDIAFVEFSSETEAATAKHGLQGFNIRPGHPLRITFAKK